MTLTAEQYYNKTYKLKICKNLNYWKPLCSQYYLQQWLLPLFFGGYTLSKYKTIFFSGNAILNYRST